MPAVSSRRRATLAVDATRSATGAPPSSHLVLVPQPLDLDVLAARPAGTPDTVQSATDRRQAFCAKLRSARERRGIPLSTIAAATKVGVSHLAALERNDLSRWPAGIYRRAWIRSYAAAVGLPVEATLEEFVVIFDPAPMPAAQPPADGGPKGGPDNDNDEAPLRLMLATPRRRAWRSFDGLRAYLVDIALALLLALIVAWASGGGIRATVAGVLALCAYAPLVAIIRRSTSRLRT